MPERTTVPDALHVLDRLRNFCGMPVRVTVLDRDSRERVNRITGVLAAVFPKALSVDCLRLPQLAPPGTPVTLEILVNGNLIWGHSAIQEIPEKASGDLWLTTPESLETLQRRRHPRVDLEIPLHLALGSTGETMNCVLRDISAGGAAFQTPEPVCAGERVHLVFDLGSGLFFEDLQAETVRCTDAPDGNYTVAVRFLSGRENEQKLADWVSRHLGFAD